VVIENMFTVYLVYKSENRTNSQHTELVWLTC